MRRAAHLVLVGPGGYVIYAGPPDEAAWARAAAGGDKGSFGKLVERNRSNDTTERRLRITGKPGFRKVHVSPWHGISG